MTDRELLGLAAKAAGIALRWPGAGSGLHPRRTDDDSWNTWNPLEDDGDALRLAVKLNVWPYASCEEGGCGRIGVWHMAESGRMTDTYGVDCWWGDDAPDTANRSSSKQSATRNAIVRAAAEIGRGMP